VTADHETLEAEQSFERYLAGRAALVDAYLDRYLPPESTPPATISRAVRYSLFAGGKRLRPVMVLAAAQAVGGEVEDALPAAAAFEMITCRSAITRRWTALASRRGRSRRLR
jgi:geranylgeranyl diphosphate synthase type II